MRAKQKNIRVFELEIESNEEFFAFMEKNLLLLKDYLLLIKGEASKEVLEFLDEKGCCFKVMEGCDIKFKSSASKESKPKAPSIKVSKEDLENFKKEIEGENERKSLSKTLVYHSPIRSGVEVNSENDITIFSRVNSGAKVVCEGNLEIYGDIDGVVECDGEYMIIKNLSKGYAIFNGDILESELFDGKLKKIYKRDDELIVEDLI
jgi:septum site-determining protein MinC